MKASLPPGLRLELVTDSSRSIRVAVENVRRTLIEGALLTILIVFLFLNSWRSTVITGLTLPISVIGTFLFMHLFGFTINNITLMALSLCVGLLIDDAIVVRENIVRHVLMGKAPFDAAMDGTKEIGLAVLATTFSIVAVFLPVGFMGGIIGKFFHEFGITIVAAVLISMFVSFTLDPMLSSIWHDPSIEALGAAAGGKPRRRTLYDKTIGRVTGWFDRATEGLADAYQGVLRRALGHKILTLALALAKRGVPSVVLDEDDTVSLGSRSICQAKHSLEIWDRFGVASRMVEKGITWEQGELYLRDKPVFRFNLQPEPGHKFPAFVNLQQYYVEEYLYDRCLSEPLVELRLRNKVVAVTPGDDGVAVEVETPDGRYTLQADWLIACDGVRSTVRHLLDLPYPGEVFHDRFLIADIRLLSELPKERRFWFYPPFHPTNSVLLHRQADNVLRVDFQLGPDADPEEEKKAENIDRRLRQ
eukprot:gene41054-54378_t